MSTTSSKNKTEISLSPSVIVFTLSALGILYFLFSIKSILTLLLLAFILMVALNPAVNRFQKTFRLPRGISIALVYVLFLLLIVATTALILPPLTQEIIRLVGSIDVPYVQGQLNGIFQNSNLEIGSLVNQFSSSVTFLVSAVTGTVGGVFTLITLMILSFYLMLDRPKLYRKIAWFTGEPKHHQRAAEFMDSLEEQLGGWVRGQVILMASIAIMTYFGLALLKIPFALPLAILAGLLEVLPNLGPFISAIPAVILAYLTFGPTMAGATIVLYIVIQTLENNLLVPRIMRTNAHVNPLISILCILIGLKLGGVIGAFLAIPIYITGRALFSAWRKYGR